VPGRGERIPGIFEKNPPPGGFSLAIWRFTIERHGHLVQRTEQTESAREAGMNKREKLNEVVLEQHPSSKTGDVTRRLFNFYEAHWFERLEVSGKTLPGHSRDETLIPITRRC
jgi:hypothetical protein